MSEKDNTQELAKNFLDLWQKQLNSMIQNPDVTGQMMQTVNMMQSQFTKNLNDAQNVQEQPKSSDSSLHEHSNDELHELQLRVSELEERLAALESESTK